ncbi:hypothetical protein ACFLZP_01595 [Patescibacteria group bacterium]
MLVDTTQIITKTQLRKDLSKFISLNRRGDVFIVSDRGELTSFLVPFAYFEAENKRERSKNKKKFDVLAATRSLRESLSKKNPDFDSVKALREVRREN